MKSTESFGVSSSSSRDLSNQQASTPTQSLVLATPSASACIENFYLTFTPINGIQHPDPLYVALDNVRNPRFTITTPDCSLAAIFCLKLDGTMWSDGQLAVVSNDAVTSGLADLTIRTYDPDDEFVYTTLTKGLSGELVWTHDNFGGAFDQAVWAFSVNGVAGPAVTIFFNGYSEAGYTSISLDTLDVDGKPSHLRNQNHD